MSNPNWRLGRGTNLHKQLEQYGEDDIALTLEEYRRLRAAEAPAAKAAPRRGKKAK